MTNDLIKEITVKLDMNDPDQKILYTVLQLQSQVMKISMGAIVGNILLCMTQTHKNEIAALTSEERQKEMERLNKKLLEFINQYRSEHKGKK